MSELLTRLPAGIIFWGVLLLLALVAHLPFALIGRRLRTPTTGKLRRLPHWLAAGCVLAGIFLYFAGE